MALDQVTGQIHNGIKESDHLILVATVVTKDVSQAPILGRRQCPFTYTPVERAGNLDDKEL